MDQIPAATKQSQAISRALFILTPLMFAGAFIAAVAQSGDLRRSFIMAAVLAVLCLIPAVMFRFRGARAGWELAALGFGLTLLIQLFLL